MIKKRASKKKASKKKSKAKKAVTKKRKKIINKLAEKAIKQTDEDFDSMKRGLNISDATPNVEENAQVYRAQMSIMSSNDGSLGSLKRGVINNLKATSHELFQYLVRYIDELANVQDKAAGDLAVQYVMGHHANPEKESEYLKKEIAVHVGSGRASRELGRMLEKHASAAQRQHLEASKNRFVLGSGYGIRLAKDKDDE